MCDALGTIIVDHLSKGELAGSPVVKYKFEMKSSLNNGVI